MNPIIICAACNKPVDSFEWWDDFDTNERHIVAKCHGARDEMTLSEEDLWSMLKNKNFPRIGRAFITQKLSIDRTSSHDRITC